MNDKEDNMHPRCALILGGVGGTITVLMATFMFAMTR